MVVIREMLLLNEPAEGHLVEFVVFDEQDSVVSVFRNTIPPPVTG